jgi:hypothetical protein
MKAILQRLLQPKRDPDADLKRLSEGLSRVLGTRLKQVIVFGSWAGGHFDPRRSDVNVMLITELPYSALQPMGPVLQEWVKRGHRPPILLAPDELDDFARGFPVEFLDIQQRHRLIFGDNPLSSLTVNTQHLAAQLEHDLAVIQLRLRQTIAIAAGDARAIRRTLIESVPSVVALLQAGWFLEKGGEQLNGIAAAEALLKKVGLDPASLLRVHEAHLRRAKDNLLDVAGHYLGLVAEILDYLRKR